MNFKHFVMIGVAGVFGLVIILVLTNMQKGDGKNRGPAVSVEIAKLLVDYKLHSAEAKERYTGKLVEVTGKLGRRESPKSDDEGIILLLTADNPDDGLVACSFSPKNRKQAEELITDEEVTVVGECAGLSSGPGPPTVMLDKCEIVKKLPSLPE